MKNFFNVFGAILLTMVMLYTTAHKSWIRLSYEINKLEIIEKFCINKEETTFQCEGKCHLKVQLEKAENPKSESTPISEENRITLFNCGFLPVEIQPLISNSKLFKIYQNKYQYLETHQLFRPPKA